MKTKLNQIIMTSLMSMIALFGFSAKAQTTPAGRLIARPKGTTSAYFGHYEYTPETYASNTTTRYPLVIFLHGTGESGNGTTDLQKLLNTAVPWEIKYGGQNFPFIMLAPQQTSPGYFTSLGVDLMVEYAKSHFRVDTDQIFVTGLSAGGYGAWEYGQDYAAKLAGIVPVCGCGTDTKAPNMVNLPVWAFHNLGDPTVNVKCTTAMIDAITNAGGHPSMTLYPETNPASHNAWTRTYRDQSMWSWLLSQRKGNKMPIVNAGNDASVFLPATSYTINGSATDNDGSIASYQWTKISGPSVTLSGTTTTSLALSNLTAGTYVFRLTVKDNIGSISFDEVTLTVSQGTNNTPPTAIAGADKIVNLPANATTLNGAGTDAEGPVTFAWSKVTGSSMTLSNVNTANLTVSNLTPGNFVFRLTVSDTGGLTSSDDVSVYFNAPPTVDAGADVSINTYNASSAILHASASDNDGIKAYTWIQLDGPAVTMTGYNTATPNINSFPSAGIYNFKVTVEDNLGAKASDIISVLVTQRIEAESGTLYDVSPSGASNAGIKSVAAHSNGKSVMLSVGDSLSVPFNVPSGEYILSVRVRSGAYTVNNTTTPPTYPYDNPKSFWPNKYVFKINNYTSSFAGIDNTISAKDPSYGYSYWGTMKSGVVTLTGGSNSIVIKESIANYAGVDYIEIEPVASSSAREPIAVEQTASPNDYPAFPNPFIDVLNIMLTSEETECDKFHWAIADITGKIIITGKATHEESKSVIQIKSLENVPTGNFIFTLKGTHTSRSVRVRKE